uniref:Amidase (AmiE) n=1 Tax=uncultured marine thaumarchaeote AD1000_39_D08 TaxID=1455913 RepID=A0A075FPV3_9ARCH|nr:Amidase (amiE) [uncultured marine thaumarchaeote AD1000_39_D08]
MKSSNRVPIGRREFIRRSGLVGAVATGSAGCHGAGEQAEELRTSQTVSTAIPPAFELDEISIASLAAAMASGERTAESITAAYLDRIAQLDRRGPSLCSLIETNPDALDIAGELDRERENGRVRSPLHGVPIVLKDNIDTADRMATTAGSLALSGSTPSRDATVARRLRDAGAVLLGKSNLSEWANFRSTRSSSGWSARGGQCRNPYVLDRNPCGSSSGSGVSVSANLVTVAIGTETDGSIVCPSSANGIVGIKPTVGLVSRAGIIPISASQDTAGPMARTMRDAVLVLGAVAGPDPDDGLTLSGPQESSLRDGFASFLDEEGLNGARIGIPRNAAGFDARVEGLMDDAIALMEERGATIIRRVDLRPSAALRRAEAEVMYYEFKAGLNAYLRSHQGAPIKSLADLIDFNETHAAEEMPYFGQERLVEAQRRGPLSDERYLEARLTARRLAGEQGIDRLMDADKLDAIVAPTGGPAWVTDLVNGDHFGGSSATFAAVAGYPNISVPAGFVHGLPVGLSFFGRAWSEPTLIRISYAFEQAAAHRRPPTFLPTVDFTE